MRNPSSSSGKSLSAASRALSWAAATCLTAAIFLGACGHDRSGPCLKDDDCDKGAVCRELNSNIGGPLSCARECTKSPDCGQGLSCRCVGSTLKGFCDTKIKGPVDADLCTADFDASVACASLCECPCGDQEQCHPGSGTLSDCRAGCEGAFTAFPSCREELNAYYECAYRNSTCVAAEVPNCINDGSGCWGTSPGQACDTTQVDVSNCTHAASWWLFFPTPM